MNLSSNLDCKPNFSTYLISDLSSNLNSSPTLSLAHIRLKFELEMKIKIQPELQLNIASDLSSILCSYRLKIRLSVTFIESFSRCISESTLQPPTKLYLLFRGRAPSQPGSSASSPGVARGSSGWPLRGATRARVA